MTAVKDRIIELFERHREEPGSPYEESHFLDFLVKPGQVLDSFRGARLFSAFIDEVQLECAVCFSLKDLESNYSISQFAVRVEKLQRSPRGSLQSFRKQYKSSGISGITIVINWFAFVMGWMMARIPGAVPPIVIVAVAANAYLARFDWRFRRYRNLLKHRIETLAAERRLSTP